MDDRLKHESDLKEAGTHSLKINLVNTMFEHLSMYLINSIMISCCPSCSKGAKGGNTDEKLDHADTMKYLKQNLFAKIWEGSVWTWCLRICWIFMNRVSSASVNYHLLFIYLPPSVNKCELMGACMLVWNNMSGCLHSCIPLWLLWYGCNTMF